MKIMFNFKEIEKIIELQESSYNLFKWINKLLKTTKSRKNTLFDEVHQTVNYYTGCLTCVAKHYSSIPLVAKPRKEDLEPFTHLLTSYLQTLFEVSPNEVLQQEELKIFRPRSRFHLRELKKS